MCVCACVHACTWEREKMQKGTSQPTRVEREEGQGNKARNEQVGHTADRNAAFSCLARFSENNTVFTNVLYKEHFSTSDGFAMNTKHYQGCWENRAWSQGFLPESWPRGPRLPQSSGCRVGRWPRPDRAAQPAQGARPEAGARPGSAPDCLPAGAQAGLLCAFVASVVKGGQIAPQSCEIF